MPTERPLRLTLDTWVLVNLDQPDEDSTAVEAILAHAEHGCAELWLTTALDRDLDRAPERLRRRRYEQIRSLPVHPGRKGGYFRLDHSALDGEDVLAPDDWAQREAALTSIVYPGRSFEQMTHRQWADIDHLVAHWRNGGDIFVTGDHRNIISRRDELKAWGVTVMPPAEARSELDRRCRHKGPDGREAGNPRG